MGGDSLLVVNQTEVRRIEVILREAGWAEHARIERELRSWIRLAKEVSDYKATVDDYTSDVCSRDYLAEALALASKDLRDALEPRVVAADSTFRQATIPDDDRRLARFYNIGSQDGWWWLRRPSSGPLAAYLAHE